MFKVLCYPNSELVIHVTLLRQMLRQSSLATQTPQNILEKAMSQVQNSPAMNYK